MSEKSSFLFLLVAALAVITPLTFGADAERQAEVAKRGAEVMPFDLKATTHIFTKTADGGTQRVVVKDDGDAIQISRIREHLQAIQTQFQNGNFSGPSKIHGQDMPGLAELKAAKPGEISMHYQAVKGGAEITYRTSNVHLVAALHTWFDAQLADHGADAMEGHHDHHPDGTPRQ